MSDAEFTSSPNSIPATVTSPRGTEGGSESTQVQREPPLRVFQSSNLPQVPGFIVTREIARGGMGVVYAAHDPIFDREVAVKVMHSGQDANRFVIESKVTAQLPHPGIPPVYALGTLPDGRPFLAMKLIGGRTLADELRSANRAADLPRLLGVFEQICQTVGFVHSHGIVHRDLKPTNVMVGNFGEVLVMDWGLAKSVVGDQESGVGQCTGIVTVTHTEECETVGGQVKGTPAYMAPEQARGERVDVRADVFALGGILAVMLTGKPPFQGHTVFDTVKKAASAEVAECFAQLAACGADVELVAIVKTCLAGKPKERFASGEDVARAVSAYRVGVEERLRQAERDRAVNAAEAREQRKRRHVQLALAAVVGISLAIGGGLAWYLDRQASERKLNEERIESERRELEAKLRGETDAEHRLKAQQARQGVAGNMKLAVGLRKQYKFKDADAALVQAAELANSGAVELLPEVEQARADLAFVAKLDDIRFRKWVWVAGGEGKGRFNEQNAPPEYRKAFAERGLDLTSLDLAEAAKQIGTSAVKAELVAAVDDWALYETNDAVRDRLLMLARKVDPGTWVDRLRDPTMWKNKTIVAQLAAEADLATASPVTLSVLAILMMRNGLDPSPLLSVARAKHPTDFELAFVLGRWYSLNGQFGQTGPYEAARALRPENVTVWINLGVVLSGNGDAAGAVAAWKEAVKLDPKDALAHYNLGWGLYARRDVEGAITSWEEAIRLDPKSARAYYDLGVAFSDKGNVEAAIAAWKEAAKLDSQDARPRINLAANYAQQKKHAEAIAYAREAIKIDSKSAKAHVILGLAFQLAGDIPNARASLTEAAKLDKRFASLLTQLPPIPVAPPPREVKR